MLGGRIKRMDDAGIDMQVLSHVQPGIEMLDDTALSIQLSKEVNNWLGDIVKQYPTRFAGFATLRCNRHRMLQMNWNEP